MAQYKHLKLFYAAAEKNKQPILKILKSVLRPNSKVLEIGSGTGQHITYFASNLPLIEFQPSEINTQLIESINAYINECKVRNVKYAEYLDVLTDPKTWLSGKIEPESVDCVVSINITHITPFICTEGLFQGTAYVLKPLGMLIMYGPFAKNGCIYPESNVLFNESLKKENPAWGLRDIDELIRVGSRYELYLEKVHDMPANNFTLIWRKKADGAQNHSTG